MVRMIGIRLLDAIPTMLLVLTLVFIAMRILPGDPALAALGDMRRRSSSTGSASRMGLERPAVAAVLRSSSGTC